MQSPFDAKLRIFTKRRIKASALEVLLIPHVCDQILRLLRLADIVGLSCTCKDLRAYLDETVGWIRFSVSFIHYQLQWRMSAPTRTIGICFSAMMPLSKHENLFGNMADNPACYHGAMAVVISDYRDCGNALPCICSMWRKPGGYMLVTVHQDEFCSKEGRVSVGSVFVFSNFAVPCSCFRFLILATSQIILPKSMNAVLSRTRTHPTPPDDPALYSEWKRANPTFYMYEHAFLYRLHTTTLSKIGQHYINASATFAEAQRHVCDVNATCFRMTRGCQLGKEYAKASAERVARPDQYKTAFLNYHRWSRQLFASAIVAAILPEK